MFVIETLNLKDDSLKKAILVEAFLNVGHSLKVGGDIGAVLRGVEHLVLGGQVVQRIDR